MKLEHADSCLSLPLHAPSFFSPWKDIWMLLCSALQASLCSRETCLNSPKISVSVLGEKSTNAKDRLESKPEVIQKKIVWELEKGEEKKKKNATYRWEFGVREYF